MPTPTEIQNSINALTTSSEPIEFTQLAAETRNSGEGISFSVATVNDLPDLNVVSIPAGQIVFVEELGIPVISSLNEWKGLDGRTLRRDYTVRQIVSWGSNDSGQFGNGTTTRCFFPTTKESCFETRWNCVSTGTSSTAGLKLSGEIWTWGSNTEGKLGIGSSISDVCSPVREFCSATNWCHISNGRFRSFAIKTDGTLWGWGSNINGRLGNGTLIDLDICSPVQEFCSATNWCQVSVGFCHSGAVKSDGSIWTWGSNTCGRLGNGNISLSCSPVREFCSATNWCAISVGGFHTSAIKTDGSLWSWGDGLQGKLGDGTNLSICSPVREISSSTNWTQVSLSYESAVALKTDGTLWAWGCNGFGRLGNGSTTNVCSPVREFCSATNWCQVSAGYTSSGAIKTDGTLWSWGENVCGILGIGSSVLPSTCSAIQEYTSSTNWNQISVGCDTTGAILIKI